MKRPRTAVSDHAIIRYLERVGGFDIERLRLEIAHRIDDAALAGATGVVIDGHVFKIKDGNFGPVVTTVMPSDFQTNDYRGKPEAGE